MTDLLRLVLVVACLSSGGIHLALASGHRDGMPELAALFLGAGAGLTLLGLTLALDVRSRPAVAAAAATLAAVLVAYGVERTIGLPLAAGAHAEHHAGGAPDVVGLTTKLVELLGLGASLLYLRASGARRGLHVVRG